MSDSDLLTISYSQVNAWQRCHKFWYWNYQREIVPKSSPDFLRLGTYTHTLLQIYYENTQKGMPKKMIVDLLSTYATEELSKDTPVSELAVITIALRLVLRYVEDIAPVFDHGAKIEAVEHHFMVELESPKGRKFFLQGYVDLILWIEGHKWIVDHKTTNGKIWSPLQLQMDGQLSTYAAVIPDTFGVGINFFNTYDYKDWWATPNEKLYKRVIANRSKKEQVSVLANFGVIVDDILDRKEANNFPYSLTKDCARCPYSELCLMELKQFGNDTVELLIGESFTSKQRKDAPDAAANGEEDSPDF